jgi:pectate lyase
VPLSEASDLQNQINLLTSGGTIWLEAGTYNSGDLTIANSNVTVMGVGRDATVLAGSLAISTGNVFLQDLWVYANGKAFGVKLYGGGGAGVPRCELRRVRVGGNSDGTGRAPSGDGPAVGLWLDSAILTVCDHCLFAFCNTGSGLYVNTTNGTWSTNVNTFRDCTFNGNAGYGVEITDGGDGVASMELHVFRNGNMEDNALGEVYASQAIGLELRGIDFESTKNLGASGKTLNINGCTNVLVEDCHSVVTGNTQRFFVFSSCGNVKVSHCRVSGIYPAGDVGVFDEASVNCTSYDNTWVNPISGSVTTTARYVNNRSQMRGYSA